MGFILQAFQRFAEWITSLISTVWTALMGWLGQLWNYVIGMFAGLLPDSLQDLLDPAQFSQFLEAIDLIGFFVLLGPVLAIVTGATGVVGAIRVLRWMGGVEILGFTIGA